MRLDKEFILEVQFGVKPNSIQPTERLEILPKEDEEINESKGEQQKEYVSSKDIKEDQVKAIVKKYLDKKSKTNKKITRINTLIAIKNSLKLDQKDTYWDEIIWAFAKYLCKDICIKRTDKTIIFRD